MVTQTEISCDYRDEGSTLPGTSQAWACTGTKARIRPPVVSPGWHPRGQCPTTGRVNTSKARRLILALFDKR